MEHRLPAVQINRPAKRKTIKTMNCNRNGETYVNTLVPVPGGSATDTSYVIDLTHFLCGNRKVCANSAFPISCNLNYQVLSVEAVGDAS